MPVPWAFVTDRVSAVLIHFLIIYQLSFENEFVALKVLIGI